jgi:hypothetical protein
MAKNIEIKETNPPFLRAGCGKSLLLQRNIPEWRLEMRISTPDETSNYDSWYIPAQSNSKKRISQPFSDPPVRRNYA